MKLADLRELARLHGVQLSYEDAAKKKRTASRDSLEAILRTRVPAGAKLDEALAARRHELATRVVEPVNVIWGRRAPSIALRLPADIAGVEYELTLENGDRFAGGGQTILSVNQERTKDESQTGLSERETDSSDRQTGLSVLHTLTLPHKLPVGYHHLRINAGRNAYETLLMVAPLRAPNPGEKSWGIFTPLYAAHTRDSWGIGDLGDLQAYRAWVNELGGGIVATLPMLASFEDEPSPYSPVSRLFWNEFFLDIERLPEWDAIDRDEGELAALRHAARVDYARISRAKRRVLTKMAERFQPDEDFERFASHASDYAEFRAHRERERRGATDERPVGTHRYHLYVQYRMAQQMRTVADAARRSGQGLYLDFPLGVNPGGYDAWRYADHFAKGVSVGAPPDLFFTKGQNWGFPPLDPDSIRAHGYDYFRACIRHHVSHAGVLRIDHVMGLHRLFWIPNGGEPKDGVYVRYRDEELYAVLLIEAMRTRTTIVGEDLGTVPEYVPQMMSRHGLRQMYVVQYELKPEGEEPAGKPPAASVASVNTHDMPTFAGFWSGRDIDNRVAQDLLDGKGASEERARREQMRERLAGFLAARGLLHRNSGDPVAILDAILAFLASSDAEIVLVNLEDLWLEPEPQNFPGVPERSWRHKLRMSLEQAREDTTVKRLLRTVEESRKPQRAGTTPAKKE